MTPKLALTHHQAAGAMQVLCDSTSALTESVDAAAIRTTAVALCRDGAFASNAAAGLPFALAPRNIEVPAEAETFLKQLTRTANAAAASVLCSSILAGHTSDADDFGDVAIYLGPGDFGPRHERDVLRLLGLEKAVSTDNGSDASLTATHPIELSAANLIPRTVNVSIGDVPGDAIQELGSLLMRLEDRYAFCVPGPEVLAFYFLLGRDEESRWMGLTGVGVHS
uniref:Phosphatase tensin-type domain-containing protein n=1 Tax=Ganoderma boninense TaxID=34458 RepID=A0A5K1JZ04_9APHY|nr:Phosphatase tensin-type domain-containing protein [Ganoderma boninense]